MSRGIVLLGMETTNINHSTYPKSLKKKTLESLRYTIKDATQAMTANPQGHKAGYYADEVHYCGMELTRRAKSAGHPGS